MAAVPAAAAAAAAAARPPVPRAVQPGKVYLVGGGPGAEDLLTLRAASVLSKADVCFFDRLSGQAGMRWLPPAAERVYVGKRQGRHPVPQYEINAQMARAALQGRTVVRLKGGDPFVFGRGGEELAHLQRLGVPFEVVPGITAATAASAYAGIPLTHRGFARSVLLATAVDKKGTVEVPWAPLLRARGTTVALYMGSKALPEVCRQMLRGGVPGDVPMAMVEAATTERQAVRVGTVATMPRLAREAKGTNSLFIIGDVVRLEPALRWLPTAPPPPQPAARRGGATHAEEAQGGS
eukprot:TRINITY_DN8850_c0_g1_i1.p1 TRINITY_DN8850_c0_g1~~TRINITY_DN8850_c0_g1_i1.p1  ORF type:complete len:317 (+),score=84.64 TRINITY_DN8850_c0_g1_i1:72-953(+)